MPLTTIAEVLAAHEALSGETSFEVVVDRGGNSESLDHEVQ